MIYIIIYLLFIIGTIYSIPNIKRKINKFIGRKLYNLHKKFYDCTPIPIDGLQSIHVDHFDAERVHVEKQINEYQINEFCGILNNIDDNKAYKEETINKMIEYAINETQKSLFDFIKEKNLIEITVDRESNWPNIWVSADITVGKKR